MILFFISCFDCAAMTIPEPLVGGFAFCCYETVWNFSSDRLQHPLHRRVKTVKTEVKA